MGPWFVHQHMFPFPLAAAQTAAASVHPAAGQPRRTSSWSQRRRPGRTLTGVTLLLSRPLKVRAGLRRELISTNLLPGSPNGRRGGSPENRSSFGWETKLSTAAESNSTTATSIIHHIRMSLLHRSDGCVVSHFGFFFGGEEGGGGAVGRYNLLTHTY